jgi:hypothetical protein
LTCQNRVSGLDHLAGSIGSPAMMHDQLVHLAAVGDRPNVELQVLPFNAQTYQTASYSFVILRFGDDAASDVIYVEDYTDASYLDRPDDVRTYTRLWSRRQAAALGPVEARRLILDVADDIQRH